MKILCAWCDQMAIGDTFERVNIMPALEQLGHEVKIFPLLNLNINAHSMAPLDYELIDTISMDNYDLMIFLLYKGIISRDTIEHITNKTDVSTLMICGDDEKYYETTRVFAPYVDNLMTTFKPALSWHKTDAPNANSIYACYSANPKIYRKLNSKKTTNVSFYGGQNDYRIYILNTIIMKDVPIRVYGNGWRPDSIITTSDCVNLINETKVNLNISIDLVNKKQILQIKGRDFEIPMAGGFLLTHANPLLEEFFAPGKEIETYADNDEMISKINFYVKNDRAREKIAQAGYERAKKEHKTVDRWRHILKNCKYKTEVTSGRK